MSAYYPQIECVLIDADGERTAAASLTFDIYNVTTSTSEGTATSDANGIIASASLGVTDGDILEFSHGTYPGVYRCVAKTLQPAAFTEQFNYGLTYVVENLQTPVDADQAILIAIDTNNPDARPITLGKALGGTTTEFVIERPSVSRTWRIYPVSQRKDGSFSQPEYTTLTSTEYEDVTISAFTLGGLAGTQTAATFFAGPVSGSAATPTFRAISMSDLGTGTPSSSNFLRGDGSWQTVAASPAGSNTQIQFNDSGSFGGDAALVWNKTDNILTVGDARIHTSGNSNNLFVGNSAGNTTLTNQFNTGIGYLCGSALTNGYYNTFLGSQAGANVTSGLNNSIFGAGTGVGITTGADNSIFGAGAGGSGNGSNRAIFGSDAGASLTSGVDNAFFGRSAGRSVTSGSNNTIFGSNAGYAATGTNMTIIGRYAGYGATGDGNTLVGVNCGYSIGSGTNNVIIGNQCGDNAVLSGCVMIGNRAGSTETNSNRLHIETSGYGATPLIYGEFDNRLMRVDANFYARRTSGAQITAEYDGSNRLEITVGSSGGVTFDAVGSGAKFTFSDSIEVADAKDIVVGTSTGTKIGTSTSQKLGFFNATPVTQRADIGALTDSTGGTPGTTIQDVGGAFDQDTLNDNFASLAAQINALRTEQRDLGFMA